MRPHSADKRSERKPSLRYSYYDSTDCRNRINEMFLSGRVVCGRHPLASGLSGASDKETLGDCAPGSTEEEERNEKSRDPQRTRILWTGMDSKSNRKGNRSRIPGFSGNFSGGGSDLILPQIFMLLIYYYSTYPGGGQISFPCV
jgi:hypothetical protein